MQRLILSMILSLGSLAVVAGPAFACTWDRTTLQDEKQVNSSYLDQSEATGQGKGDLRSKIRLLTGVVGVLMMVGGGVAGIVHARVSQRAPASQDGPSEGQP